MRYQQHFKCSHYSVKATTQSLVWINLFCALWITVCCNFLFFKQIWQYNHQAMVFKYLFLLASGVLLTAYIFFVETLFTWGQRFAQIILTVLLVISGLIAYFSYSYGVGIDEGQIQNVIETDPKEVKALISARMVFELLLLIVPPTFIVWRKCIAPIGFIKALAQKVKSMAVALLVMLVVIGVYFGTYVPMFREHRQLRDFITPHNGIAGLLGYYDNLKPMQAVAITPYGQDATQSQKSKGKPRLLLLIVGETARAGSFSLGGYERNTNPHLSQLPVYYFANTSSCGTATAVSVPCIFSGMPRADYDESTAKSRQGLLDITQRAGVASAWIDNNSGCKGACDRVEKIALPTKTYPKLCEHDLCWDEILTHATVDYLKTAPVKDRIVVLHQAGSHGPAYYLRYPNTAKLFTPTCDTNDIQNCARDSLINTYDNTIVYTDTVLADLIKTLQKENRYDTALLYVSDHGESTGEKGLYLHGAPYLFAPIEQTHVPMLTWFSDSFVKNYSNKTQCMVSKQHSTVSHDNIFPTVLGLFDIKTQVKNNQLDLTQCL